MALESFATIEDREKRRRYLELQRRRLEAEKRRREILKSQEIEETVAAAYNRAVIEAFPLHQFIREAFNVLHSGREFFDNWHISVISELLQAAVLREVRDFIINIPRRTMKSNLVCVMFPCWVWTFLPHTRFLFTSYSANFAARDNKACYTLINSPWYQQNFGDKFTITEAQQSRRIGNDKGGVRMVFKIGGGTGEGGDFVIADDPNSIEKAESEGVLQTTNTGWTEISYNNVTDRKTAVRGIIQQRTTTDDLTGYITEDEELKEIYSVLCLAMRYEADNPLANTPEKPLCLGKVSEHECASNPNLVAGEPKLWIDPRDVKAPDFENTWYREWYRENFADKGLTSRGEGQLLWENYIDEETAVKEIAHLKGFGVAAQHQQRPIRRGGNFFNSAHFEEIKFYEMPINDPRTEGMLFVRIWDKAGTDGDGDWTVGMLIARTRRKPYMFYIVDVFREQLSYYARMEKMKEIAKEDVETYIKPYENAEFPNEYEILIEKEGNSSGTDLSIIERDELIQYDVIFVNPRTNKGIRAKPAKLLSESGRIKVIKAKWNPQFFREVEKFHPEKANQRDDQIDTMAHGINRLRRSSHDSSNPSDGVI